MLSQAVANLCGFLGWKARPYTSAVWPCVSGSGTSLNSDQISHLHDFKARKFSCQVQTCTYGCTMEPLRVFQTGSVAVILPKTACRMSRAQTLGARLGDAV